VNLDNWLGSKPQDKLKNYWSSGLIGSLPADFKGLVDLKGESLKNLLIHWNAQWNQDDVKDERKNWEGLWEKISNEEKITIQNVVIHIHGLGHVDIPEGLKDKLKNLPESVEEEGKRRPVLVEEHGKSWLIGNYCFWVYFYRGPGQFKRIFAESKGIGWLQDRLHDLTTWWQREPRQSWYGVVAQLLILLVFGMVMVGHSPAILSAVTVIIIDGFAYFKALLQSELVIGLVVIAVSVYLWILIIERPLRESQEDSNTWYHFVRQVSYALPFALWVSIQLTALFLPEQSLPWSLLLIAVIWVIFLVSLILPYSLSLPQEWDWFRFLVVILPIVGAALLWPVYQLESFLLEWISVGAVTFVILRLWWFALERRPRSSDPVTLHSQTQPGRLGEWLSKILGLETQYLAKEGVPMTLLIVLLLIFGHLLWLRLRIAPVRFEPLLGHDPISITVIHPPFLSTSDRGDVLLNVTNSTTVTMPVTMTASVALGTCNDNTESPLAVWMDGEVIVGRHFVIVAPPGQTVYKPLVLRVLPLNGTGSALSTIEVSIDTPIITEPADTTIPIVSRFLPGMYASSNTLLAWLFGLAWGIAQVVAAGFLAMRGSIETFSSQKRSGSEQSVNSSKD
jgi:hypothetical protein